MGTTLNSLLGCFFREARNFPIFNNFYKNSFRKEEKCPLNPTTKRKKRLRLPEGLLRRPNNKKMQEKPLLERKQNCKPRELQKGKRKLENLSANDNLVKWILLRNNSKVTGGWITVSIAEKCQ